MKASTLKKQAQYATKRRGHRMLWAVVEGYPKWEDGICRDCGMDVRCNTDPAPNEVDISGEALAANCGDHEFTDTRRVSA